MNTHKAALVLVLIAVIAAFPAASSAEQRFGPWAYYAPYYFPPGLACIGHCFTPLDLLPRYESPNPEPPSSAVPPCTAGPPARPAKVAARAVPGETFSMPRAAVRQPAVLRPHKAPAKPMTSYETRPGRSAERYQPPERSASRYPAGERPITRANTGHRTSSQPRLSEQSPGSSYAPRPGSTAAHNAPANPTPQYRSPSEPEPVKTPPTQVRSAPEESKPMTREQPSYPLQERAAVRSAPPAEAAYEYEAPKRPAPTQDQTMSEKTSETGTNGTKRTWTWGRPSQAGFGRPSNMAPARPKYFGTALY
ncbi:MAG: hypothetical protein HY914_02600 [Desulfomonile tiedjei]|nr:hypothetical protein [Desulfomonile tiedjei]